MIGQAERIVELNRLKTAQRTEKQTGGKIIAFSSGKGGTGKTFIALNTAFALAASGKKILLVDMDQNLSNINIMMNQKAEKTIIEFYLNKSPLRNLITHCYTNLHIIFGDSGRTDYPIGTTRYSDYLLKEIRELSREYEYIFLDISSGATDDIICILKQADCNVIITNPEPTAVMDAYVIIKMLHTGGVNSEKLVVINKCHEDEEGKISFDNLSRAAFHFLSENVKLIGVVNFDKSISTAIINQEIYLKNNSFRKPAVQIKEVATNLVKFTQVANSDQSKSSIG